MRQQIWKTAGFAVLLALLCSFAAWSGTTGKIAGTVIDKVNGGPLPGANVVIVGTTLGAAADLNGQFTILYIPPGSYDVQVSMMGYTKVMVRDVQVHIDQTARVDFALEVEQIEMGEITVVAERTIIKPDVATSVVAVSAQEVEELPVSSVQSVVGLQAGIQGGLQIRGGGADEALFLLDGATLRDPRNNNPVSGIALSAIKEISVERGGFNAEYGQVRSGIVNVVTREGGKHGYYGNIELKYSPPTPKYFGISPFDRNSGWLRPYYDDAVCWTGTKNGEPFTDENQNGMWDQGEPFTDLDGNGIRSYWNEYTQRQYADFEGWNAVSERLMTDNDPTNNLSPLGAQRKFMWETRKEPAYDQPDYNIDAGFGGPIPLISSKLGNLRFFTAYRQYREMLLVPLTRDDYLDYDWSMKVTSDITPSMKLMISGLIGKQYTMQQNDLGFYVTGNYLRYPGTIAGAMQEGLTPLFGTGVFSLADISHTNLAAKLTHVLNASTFYEISVEHFRRDYYSRPPDRRDKTKKYEIVSGYLVDEAPFGYDPNLEMGDTGMLFGGFTCLRRDNTNVSSTTLKADLSSQVNFSNLLKAGIEFAYNDLDFDYGIMANFTDTRWSEHVLFSAKPIRAALYLQDKLETKGFIMNLGMRLDYSNSNTDWWDVDIFDKSFFTSKYSEDQKFNMVESKSQWQLSPRLGISHPITENSKLFFNYGHFKQMPSYETLFHIGRAPDGRLISYGDPDLILAKTISYELGYDHALFNDYLIQLAAFYHDISDQQNTTEYTSVGGISYSRTTSNSYEDIRGFEITLRKNRGRWWTFFGNYTYQVNTAGNFGRQAIYEDPSRQKLYDETTVNLYQQRPIPRPYARLNLSVYTPDDYGPLLSGIFPLGGYTANLLLNWQAGQWVTWNPKGVGSIVNNVQQTDYFDAVLRLSKTFNISKLRIQAFVDINNLFNYRRMSLSNFGGRTGDRQYYYDSLHLPASEAYDNIPGDDRIGTYRKEGVAYQPMFLRGAINYALDTGDPGVIYYDKASERYVEYIDGVWMDIEKGRLDKILEDKAYIDMPNQDSFTFLNPRQIFFGIRVSFNLD